MHQTPGVTRVGLNRQLSRSYSDDGDDCGDEVKRCTSPDPTESPAVTSMGSPSHTFPWTTGPRLRRARTLSHFISGERVQTEELNEKLRQAGVYGERILQENNALRKQLETKCATLEELHSLVTQLQQNSKRSRRQRIPSETADTEPEDAHIGEEENDFNVDQLQQMTSFFKSQIIQELEQESRYRSRENLRPVENTPVGTALLFDDSSDDTEGEEGTEGVPSSRRKNRLTRAPSMPHIQSQEEIKDLSMDSLFLEYKRSLRRRKWRTQLEIERKQMEVERLQEDNDGLSEQVKLLLKRVDTKHTPEDWMRLKSRLTHLKEENQALQQDKVDIQRRMHEQIAKLNEELRSLREFIFTKRFRFPAIPRYHFGFDSADPQRAEDPFSFFPTSTQGAKGVTLYVVQGSLGAWQVNMTLEDLGIPRAHVHVLPEMMMDDQLLDPEITSVLRKINPAESRLPGVVDHDNDDLVIFSADPILIYLAEASNQLLPTTLQGRSEALQWLMWRTSSRDGFSDEQMYHVLNAHLATRRFIASDTFTIADISILAWLIHSDKTCPDRQISFDGLTHLRSWYGRVNSRPAMQRGHDLTQFEWLRPLQTHHGKPNLKVERKSFTFSSTTNQHHNHSSSSPSSSSSTTTPLPSLPSLSSLSFSSSVVNISPRASLVEKKDQRRKRRKRSFITRLNPSSPSILSSPLSLYDEMPLPTSSSLTPPVSPLFALDNHTNNDSIDSSNPASPNQEEEDPLLSSSNLSQQMLPFPIPVPIPIPLLIQDLASENQLDNLSMPCTLSSSSTAAVSSSLSTSGVLPSRGSEEKFTIPRTVSPTTAQPHRRLGVKSLPASRRNSHHQVAVRSPSRRNSVTFKRDENVSGPIETFLENFRPVTPRSTNENDFQSPRARSKKSRWNVAKSPFIWGFFAGGLFCLSAITVARKLWLPRKTSH